MRSGSGRRIVGWVLSGLVLAAVLCLVFVAGGRFLRGAAVARIRELLPDAVITAEPIDFNIDGSVVIENLLIRPRLMQGDGDAILRAERVEARFGVGSLLLLRPRLKELRVRGLSFNAQYDYDANRWNIAALRLGSFKGGRGKLPAVNLERGTLKYSKAAGGEVTTVMAVPIDARFGPAGGEWGGYMFAMTTAKMSSGFARSELQGFWRPGKVTIAGGISSADIPFFERAWSVDGLAAELNYDLDKDYSLKLRIRDLVSRQGPGGDRPGFDKQLLLKKVGGFTALQTFFHAYRPGGRIDIELEASGNFERMAESEFSGTVYCKGVSVYNRKFPYLIGKLVGPIEFGKKGILIKELRGRHKDVELSINGSLGGGANRRSEIRITSGNMVLDEDLYAALDARQKRLWRDFSPSGVVGMSYTLSQEPGEDKKYALDVDLLGVEARYATFPYPLKNLTGRLLFDHNSIEVDDMVSQYDGRRIAIGGEVTATDTNAPVYDLLIKVRDVPLDSTLAAALPPAQRNLYNQFHLTGLGDGQIKVYTQQQGPARATFTADLDVTRASLRAESPAVAISDVSAQVVVTPTLVHVESLNGLYAGSGIWLKGRLWPEDEESEYGYCLSVRAEQLVLTSELFAELPEQLGKLVSEVRPEGKVNLRADLNKAARGDCPDYKAVVECLGNNVCFERFPYPLKDVRGSVMISEDGIKLKDITARPAQQVQIGAGDSTIRIDGEMALGDDVLGDGRFRLGARDVFLDERLGAVLPGSFRDSYFKLSPTGRFDLNLEDIKVFGGDNGEKCVDFGGTIRFKGCNLNVSPEITGVDGELEFEGLYEIGDGLRDGELVLLANSLRVEGVSITKLEAKDVCYDVRQHNWRTNNLVGECHGGRLAGRFGLRQSAGGAAEYSLDIGFVDIDLNRFLRDWKTHDGGPAGVKAAEASETGWSSGRMSGSLSVKGLAGDRQSRMGRCRFEITDMEVGELSPLAKLLYVLRLTEPKDFAFDRMVVDSYVKQDKLFFERFDLSGEAIAFSGSGWLNLETKELDLTLTARGHRLGAGEPSILESLTEDIGLAVVRMEVTGDFRDPQVTTTALPVVKGAMELLGAEPVSPR